MIATTGDYYILLENNDIEIYSFFLHAQKSKNPGKCRCDELLNFE
jgi:hypothetical protein